MEALKSELGAVLEELAPLLREPDIITADGTPPDLSLIRETIGLVRPLLLTSNTDCLEFIGSLRMVPGSKELIRHMENLDFEPALESLAILENSLDDAVHAPDNLGQPDIIDNIQREEER
jgi:hypothetical protein